jgi:D-xylose transport system substrate-binding protein
MIRETALFIFSILISFGTYCQDSLKIGFSVGDFSSDRWSQEPQYFKDAANVLGAKVLFEFAYGNAGQQLKQAKKLIASGVKVLVVFPTGADNWAEVIDLAHKNNVIVIAYDRLLKNVALDYYVSFDNEDVGRQQAKYAIEKHPKGNYILLEGPTSDYNAILYLKAQKEILQPNIGNGDITIVLEKHMATWNSIDAYMELQTFLETNTGEISAIVAANDELAGGSIMALDMVKETYDITITGQDASPGGCQNIIDGKQSMTLYKSIRNLAKEAAAMSVKLSKGEKINNLNAAMNNGLKDVPALLLKTVVVDINNLKETVIADGFVKAEQLNFKH